MGGGAEAPFTAKTSPFFGENAFKHPDNTAKKCPRNTHLGYIFGTVRGVFWGPEFRVRVDPFSVFFIPGPAISLGSL